MSKLKRSALKSVVKECLLEILSEGINTNTDAASMLQSRGNAAAQQELTENKEENTQSDAMRDTIAGITSDPILASVLGDTAKTTLVEQAGADRTSQLRKMRSSGSTQTSSLTQNQEDDGNSHWAALAFADKK
jgi:hypothetical protein